MSHRVVNGLTWARACERPKSLPVGRPRGAKAEGVRYERALAKALPLAAHGCWWHFRDRLGEAHCQTDLLLEREGIAYVLEAKYTWTPTGHSQLEQLYLPVVAWVKAKPAFGIVVCRRLLPGMPDWVIVTGDLDEALALARQGHRPVLHWIGVPGVLSRGRLARPAGPIVSLEEAF